MRYHIEYWFAYATMICNVPPLYYVLCTSTKLSIIPDMLRCVYINCFAVWKVKRKTRVLFLQCFYIVVILFTAIMEALSMLGGSNNLVVCWFERG